MGMAPIERFDPFLPAVHEDPYPFYAHLRAQDPVHWGMPFLATQPGAWYISRYADVARLLKDPAYVKNLRTIYPPEALPPVPEEMRFFAEVSQQSILLSDPPHHGRLRKLVSQAFTPRMVEQLREAIGMQAAGLLDEIGGSGELDLIADYAFPLTLHVIATLIGVPTDQHERLSRWSSALVRTLDLAPSPATFVEANQVAHEAFAFFGDLIAERRAPSRRHMPEAKGREGAQPDLLSALIAAHDQEDKLTEAELIVMCTLLLLAGFDTTINLIGNGMLALLQHPDQLALLRERPQLLPSAIEELLRFEPSTQKALRYATADGELHGRQIRQGQAVIVLLGSANRDPAVFADPDRLDITRSENRHLGFGAGIHVCLGAPLARLEGQIAIDTLLRRYPHMTLLAAKPEWREDVVTFRRLARLPVALD